MKSFKQIVTQLNEESPNEESPNEESPNEESSMPTKYKSDQVVKDYKFGKYRPFLDRIGFVHPFDLKILSSVTRRHIQDLMNVGWTFDKIIVSPVDQGYKWANSFVVVGKDPYGEPAVWDRKETVARGAGQSYIRWEDFQMKALDYLASGEFKKLHDKYLLIKRTEEAIATNDASTLADCITELI
jgi:hypothetical protein